MYLYACFDVEDLVHPDSDDIARDIADLLAGDGLVGSMFVVGEKARLWERRGRHDVLAAVGFHDGAADVEPEASPFAGDFFRPPEFLEHVRQLRRRDPLPRP